MSKDKLADEPTTGRPFSQRTAVMLTNAFCLRTAKTRTSHRPHCFGCPLKKVATHLAEADHRLANPVATNWPHMVIPTLALLAQWPQWWQTGRMSQLAKDKPGDEPTAGRPLSQRMAMMRTNAFGLRVAKRWTSHRTQLVTAQPTAPDGMWLIHLARATRVAKLLSQIDCGLIWLHAEPVSGWGSVIAVATQGRHAAP